MLKTLFVAGLAATAAVAAPFEANEIRDKSSIANKNSGFEIAAVGNQALPQSWDFSKAKGCHRTTKGHSPQGKARVVCSLNSGAAKNVTFTQGVPLLSSTGYTLTSALRFHLPAKAAMGVSFAMHPGGSFYHTKGCGYAYDGKGCYVADNTWTTVGGDTVLVHGGKREPGTLVATFVMEGEQGSVEIDKMLLQYFSG